jgi:predicted flap endonuclease-1-like 5' DNA nuclease
VWARSTHPPPFSDFKSDPNRFNGTISTLVGLLTGLTALYLHGGNRNSTHQFSNITGTLPTELGRLSLLQEFNCVNQRVTGTIPTEMAQLTRVRYLEITGNTGLTGSFEHLFELSTLTFLGLGNQLFGGTLSSRVSALTEIRVLSLPAMGLSGTMPQLTALSKLTSLRIPSNAFHGQFPELNSTSISILEIRRNRFSGALRLPESVFNRSVADFVCQLQNLATPNGETNCLNCNDAPSLCVCQARNCTPFMPPTTTTTTMATTTTTTATAKTTTTATTTATTTTTAATTTTTTAATTATPVSTSTMTTTAATTAAPVSTSTTASQSAAFSDAANESPDVTGIAIGASVGALVAVIGIAGIAFWACRKRTDKPENSPAKKGEPSGDYGLLPPSVSRQYEQGRLSPSQLEPDYGRGRISGD